MPEDPRQPADDDPVTLERERHEQVVQAVVDAAGPLSEEDLARLRDLLPPPT